MTLNTSNGILLARGVANNDATLDFDDVFTSDHTFYEITIENLVPQTDDQVLQCRFGNAAVYESGAATYHWFTKSGSSDAITVTGLNSNSATEIQLTRIGLGSATNEKGTVTIQVSNPVAATHVTTLTTQYSHRIGTASTIDTGVGGGGVIAPTSYASIQFLFASGNLTTGNFSIYAKPE